MIENKAPDNQSWESWSNYVLKTIDRIEENVNELDEKVNESNLKIQTDIVELKVKAGLIAAIASIIISFVISLMAGYIVNHLKDDVKKIPIKPANAYYYEIKTLPQPKYNFEEKC